MLLAKRSWARVLLDHVVRGEIDPQDVTVDQLRTIAAHGDSELDAIVRKYWGSIHSATPEERLAVARRLNNDLRAAVGHADRGHEVFRKQCSNCHKLFGEGETIGPDLTHANRKDRSFLLASIVDPSAVVRKEYASYTVQTTDGRVLSGLIADQDDAHLTLLTAKNERLRAAARPSGRGRRISQFTHAGQYRRAAQPSRLAGFVCLARTAGPGGEW